MLASKLTHAAVHYVPKSRTNGESCAGCDMYVAGRPPACTLVRGPIYPSGWCDRFEAKTKGMADGGRVGYADGGALPDAPWASSANTLPDAPWAAAPKAAEQPSLLAKAASPVTGIPSEIYKAGAEALDTVNDYLNPFSKAYQDAAQNRTRGEGGWTDPGTVLGTGKGLLSALALPAAPITGAARSLIGRPMSWAVPNRTPEEQEKLRQAGVSEEMIPGATSEETYEKTKGHVDTALMGLKPQGASPVGVNATVALPPAPAKGPLGVTLSEGQATGELPLIQREQAALRGQMGETAQARAQEFADQQRGQVRQATEDVSRQLDPHNGIVAETPQEAGQLVSEGIQQAAAQRKAAVDRAYEEARALPGDVQAQAFDDITSKIKTDLSARPDPIVIDDRLTPFASHAIRDVEDRVANLIIQNRADPLGQPAQQSIAGISLRGIDQMRRRLTTFRRDAWKNNDADGRAASAVVEAFDNHIDSAINGGLFKGDPRAIQAWNDARAAHADYKQTFSAGKNDPAGRVVERILGKGNNPAAIPNDVADFLYGSSGTNPSSLNVTVARRVRDILGEQSPEWAGIKQGLFQRLIESGPGVKDFGPGKIAQRLNKFMNADGIELSREVYSPAERRVIQQFADLQRKLDVPQAGANWSNTSTILAPILKKVSGGIAALVGAAVGHTVAPGLYGAGEAAGAAAATRVSKTITDARELRRLSTQMPLVADQMKAWQKATAAAVRNNTPMTQRALGVASANLGQSLQRLGVDPRVLAPQGTVPARADHEQQQQ